MTQSNYAEFSNPKIAQVYDSFNALGDDEAFWLRTIDTLGVQRIIDLGCGTGLLTCALARLGYDVVGVEPAQAMITLAKQKEHAESVKWILGSTKQLQEESAQLVLMTSHVAQFFLSEEEWKNALQHMHAALETGVYMLFDSKNPLRAPWKNWAKEHTKRVKTTPLGDVEFWIDSPVMKDKQVEYELHYVFLDTQEELVSKNTLIYRSKDELIADLTDAGFSIKQIYGDWNGGELTDDSEEMIFLAQKS